MDVEEDAQRKQKDRALFERQKMLEREQEILEHDQKLAVAIQDTEIYAEKVRAAEEENKIACDAAEALRRTQQALLDLQREEEKQVRVKEAAEQERRRQEEERRRLAEEEARRRSRDPNIYLYPPSSWYHDGREVQPVSVKIK